jgi:hypothetical protein
LPAANGDPIEYLHRQITEQLKALAARLAAIRKERRRRLGVAYGFKLTAALGGLAISTGLPQRWAQGLGILIAVCLVLDRVFANHRRLIAVVAAKNAFERLERTTASHYNSSLTPTLHFKDQDKRASYEALLQHTFDDIHTQLDQIETALAEQDLKILDALSLEKDAKTIPMGGRPTKRGRKRTP